jgi:hypothetical protein
MSRAPIFRLALAAVLLLALAAPPAVAAASPGHSSPPGLVDTLWQWLHALWAADGGVAPAVGAPRASVGSAPFHAVVAADGGYIDPFGSKVVSSGHVPNATGKGGAGKEGPRQH